VREYVFEDATCEPVPRPAGASAVTRLETFSTHLTVLRFGCSARSAAEAGERLVWTTEGITMVGAAWR